MNTPKSLLLLPPLLFLTACTPQPPTAELEYKTSNDPYTVTEYINQDGQYSPTRLVTLEDRIIATDKTHNCLLIIDKATGTIETSGEKGSGQGEFSAPTGIQYKDGSFYVVDSKNSRIQILDSDLNYKSEVSLEEITLEPYGSLDDLAIDDSGNIYLTVDTPRSKLGNLYRIESDTEKISVVMKKFTGAVTSYKNKIYFTNTYEYVSASEAMSGEHYIYELENGQLTNRYKLPDSYTPTSIYVDDSGIYCSSMAYREVSKVNTETLEVEELFSEPTSMNETKEQYRAYGALAKDGGTLYLCETSSGKIYRLENI